MSLTEQPSSQQGETPPPVPPDAINPPPVEPPPPPFTMPYGTLPQPGPYTPRAYVPRNQPGSRPGCVTAGVMLMAFGILVLLCGGFMFMYLPRADEAYKNTRECMDINNVRTCGPFNKVMIQYLEWSSGSSIQTLAIIFFTLALLTIPAAVGVWKMKRWGWRMFLGVGSMWLIIWLLSLLAGAVLNVIWIGTMGWSLYWFTQNKWRFV